MSGATVADDGYVGRLREISTGLVAAIVLVAIAVLGQVHPAALAAGLFLAQVALALAWFAAVDAPGSIVGVAIVAAAGGVADWLVGVDSADAIGQVAAVVGLAFAVSLLYQLYRRPRPHVVASLSATLSGVVLGMSLAAWLALHVVSGGDDSTVCGALAAGAALVVGRFVDAVYAKPALGHPASRRYADRGVPGFLLGLAAAGGVGALVGGHQDFVGAGLGWRLGVATALLALIGDLVGHLAADNGRRAVVPLTVLMPAVLAGPAAYVAGRILLG